MYLNKKIYLGVLGLLVFVGVLFFRERVSLILGLGRENAPVSFDEAVLRNVAPSPDATAKGGAPQSSASVSPSPSAESLYQGRDPSEVRAVPEEVKLFTEEQRKKLFASIIDFGNVVKERPSTSYNEWMQIGILKKTIGDFEGARDAWEFVGILWPDGAVSFANLGELYWRYLHDYPKAEKNFRISIKNKTDPLTYISLADLYHYSYKEKYELADDVLLEGLKVEARDLNLMKHLAYIYSLRGEFVESIKWWKEVLADDPTDESVKDEIARLEKKLEAANP